MKGEREMEWREDWIGVMEERGWDDGGENSVLSRPKTLETAEDIYL